MGLSADHTKRLNQLPPDATPDKIEQTVKLIQLDGGPTPGTQVVRLSHIKRYFIENGRKHWVQYVDFPIALLDEVKADREDRLQNRTNMVITRAMINKLESLQSSEDAIELATWCLFASGRRFAELMECHFERHSRTIIKTRDLKKKRVQYLEGFSLLPGVNADDWLESVDCIRCAFGDITPNAVNRAISRYLKGLFGPRMSAHKLRGIYANLLWRHSGRYQIKTGFIKKALNLESQDIAINYSSYIFE